MQQFWFFPHVPSVKTKLITTTDEIIVMQTTEQYEYE